MSSSRPGMKAAEWLGVCEAGQVLSNLWIKIMVSEVSVLRVADDTPVESHFPSTLS